MGPKGWVHAKEVAALLGNEQFRDQAAAALGAMGENGAAFAKELAEIKVTDQFPDAAQNALSQMVKTKALALDAVAPLLQDQNGNARRRAVRLLGDEPEGVAVYRENIAALLKDADSAIRREALYALKDSGGNDAKYLLEVTPGLADEDQNVRDGAYRILDRLGNPDGDWKLQAALLSAGESLHGRAAAELRAHLRLWAGDNADMQRSVTWLGKPGLSPMPKAGLEPEEMLKTLVVFSNLWESTSGRAALRQELLSRIREVAKSVRAKKSKLDGETEGFMRALAAKLRGVSGADSAYDAVSSVMRK
jgi:hypothetical protein